MKIAIMQPYFFPYLGYFALIKYSELFIIFDTVQYIRHGWIDRNRILKPLSGWQYINIPLLTHSRATLIQDIRIRNSEDWRVKILRQIGHYRKFAPYYSQVHEFLEQVFQCDYESIAQFNTHLLSEACRYLGMNFNSKMFSEMNLKIEPVKVPGDWALNISKAMCVSEYINPIGGLELFNKTAFMDAGIKLSFLKIKLKEYKQDNRQFEPGLSIIDVMMFNNSTEIKKMLNEYELI